MAKKARRPQGNAARVSIDPSQLPVVGRREPCPCGSGRRYKDCHGGAIATAAEAPVARPFAGLPGECDWVAMREIVPAATATVRTTAAFGAREATIATVLPMAWPGLHRTDGAIFVGLQTALPTGTNPAREVAATLLSALEAEPGNAVGPKDGEIPALTDLIDVSLPFEVQVHEGFDFWLEHPEDAEGEVRESLERANATAVPTVRLTSVEAAYWCQVGTRRHVRWVMPEGEEDLLDALARLHATGASALLEGSRYVGAFRTDGLLVPVWDLADDTEAEEVEDPAKAFYARLHEALADTTPLSIDERRARAGLVSRQLTLR